MRTRGRGGAVRRSGLVQQVVAAGSGAKGHSDTLVMIRAHDARCAAMEHSETPSCTHDADKQPSKAQS